MATTVDTLLVEIKAETRQLKQGLNQVNKQLDQTKIKSKGVSSNLKMVAGAIATLGASVVVGNIVSTIRTFEDLEATLRAVTGSANNAALSFDLIRAFTSKTTFQIEEVAQAFITLKQAGVVPTAGVLQDFGNFAAGMGKSITQLAQAAFNATTGEMEMLKQFGVIARQQGDKITVTFDGVTKEIDRSGEAVIDFLRSIGREKFPTAIEERANTLSGALSNLGDSTSEFFVAIGDAGFAQALTNFSRKLSEAFNNAGLLAEAIGETLTMAFKVITEPIMLVINNLKIFISLLVGASIATIVSNIQGLVTIFIALGTAIRNTTIFASAFKAITGNLKSVIAGLGAATVTYIALEKATKETAESADDLAEKSEKVEKNVKVTIDPLKRLTGSVKDLNKAFQSIKAPELTIADIVANAGGLDSVFKTLEKDYAKFFEQSFADIPRRELPGPVLEAGGILETVPQVDFDHFRESFFKKVFGMTEDQFNKRMQIELLPIEGKTLLDSLKSATDVTEILNKSFESKSPEFFKIQLKDMGEVIRNEFGLSIDEAAQKLADFYNKGEAGTFEFSKSLQDALTAASLEISTTFVEAIRTGENALQSFRDLALRIVDQIIAAFIQMQVIDPILAGIFKTGGGGNTGDTGLTDLGGAGGGAMHVGQARLVGERGPELFIPHANGTLLNNMNTKNAMGGGQTVVVNQSVNFATGVQATVRNEVLQLMPQIAEVTKSAVSGSAERSVRFRGALQGA
jgi:hypothetical protein